MAFRARCLSSIMQVLLFVVLAVGVTPEVRGQKHNVCPTIVDYFSIQENSRCWYDVAADLDVPNVIRARGYPVEVHKVTTADGYILTLHRIPNTHHSNPKRYPVFLQHGLIATSATFVTQSRNVSMAFSLADAGYDVWLGNYRGTTYSQDHINLSVRDNQYWDHSMDELGHLDIPAMLEKVISVTGKRGDIILVGHSLGTTISMIYSSTYPEEARRNIKLLVLLAPAATLTNMISPFRILAPLAPAILEIIKANDLVRLVSSPNLTNLAFQTICFDSPVLMKRCQQAFNLFYGPYNQMGAELLPVFFRHLPAGTSIHVIRHAADLVLGKFHMYDHGPIRNKELYGSEIPPQYNVTKIKVPTFIMYAVNDWACGKKDALVLYRQLSPGVTPFGIMEINERNFNHMDFIFGRDAKQFVTNNLLRLFDKLDKLS